MSSPSSLPHVHGPVFQIGDIYDPVESLIRAGFDDQRTLARLREKFSNAVKMREFYYGSISGLFFLENDWLNVLAVINHSKGNGYFGQLMKLLEAHENVRVLHLMNDELTNLIVANGYIPVETETEGTVYEKAKSPPRDQRERRAVEGDPQRVDDLVPPAPQAEGLHPKPD